MIFRTSFRPCVGVFAILFFSLRVVGQPATWNNSTKWKLYLVHRSNDEVFSKESLLSCKSILLERDSLLSYLVPATGIDSNRSSGAVWMGEYWVSFDLKDSVKILRVSRYGGFFVDVDSGAYYEIPLGQRSSWYQFLTREYMKMENPN